MNHQSSKQDEEIEALVAIYGEDFQVEDPNNRSYSIKIVDNCDGNFYVKLYIKLPYNYPNEAPPTFEISAPYLKIEKKNYLCNCLQDVYLSYIGESVIYQWIERIREEMQSGSLKEVNNLTQLNSDKEDRNSPEVIVSCPENSTLDECPKIFHGEVIKDRKSVFQGHAATVTNVQEVRRVLAKLKENRKIQDATHNIYAYRIHKENQNIFIHDCDDDGESQAGGRLLHLLQIMDAKNVMVVVSRWYGGTLLGPDRFRHINNAARQVLEAANLIPQNHVKTK